MASNFFINLTLFYFLLFISNTYSSLCPRVKVKFCSEKGNSTHPGLKYPIGKTYFPNFLGHTDQKTAKEAIKPYMRLVDSKCSPYIRMFLCASFVPVVHECPKADIFDGRIPPCASLCQLARKSCEETLNQAGLPWPPELDCCNFPDQQAEQRGECTTNPTPERCLLHREPGPCNTFMQRFYFDSEENKCKVFTFGGCIGNGNNFRTEAECKRTCLGEQPQCNGNYSRITAPSPATTPTVSPTNPVTTVIPTDIPPSFTVVPRNVTALPGETVEFLCEATGADEYRWIFDSYYLNGTSAEGFAGSILRLNDVTAEDEGCYACVAENEYDIVTRYACLTVITPPEIPLNNSQINPKEGDNVELKCMSRGKPKPYMTWLRKDGTPVPTRREGNKLIAILDQISREDAGTYICTATNAGGRSNITVNVIVKYKPYIFTNKELIDKKCGLDENVSFTCVAKGVPAPDIIWTPPPNQHLNRSSYIVIETMKVNATTTTSTIRIPDVTRRDEGTYRCQARNEEGRYEVSVDLCVVVPPTITAKPVEYQVLDAGDNALFVCNATGTPTPIFRWRKADDPDWPGNDARISVENGSRILRISSTSPRDSGTYTCIIRNSAGHTTASAEIEVNAREDYIWSRLHDKTGDVITTVGSKVNLICNASGDPRPAITWYDKNGYALDLRKRYENGSKYELDGFNLVINDVTKRDEGPYRCFSLSIEGWSLVSWTRVKVHQNGNSNNNNIPSDDPNLHQVGTSIPLHPLPGVKPRRTDITNTGTKDLFVGWVDVQGQGAANDFCRVITLNEDGPSYQLACSLAGTDGEEEFNYVSQEDFDVGYQGTAWMRDEDGDGKDDYCRCTQKNNKRYVSCTKAGTYGFHGMQNSEKNTTNQYSFNIRGDRYYLRRCRRRYVDPFFGHQYESIKRIKKLDSNAPQLIQNDLNADV